MSRRSWNVDTIRKEALNYKFRGEFATLSRSCYNAARRLNILDDVCSHMTDKLVRWSDDMLFKEALKYNSRNDFKKNSHSAYEATRCRGLLDDACRHMDCRFTWTCNSIAKEALKYEFKSDFCKYSHGAYAASKRFGIFENVTSHMEKRRKGSWTFKQIQAKALEYSTRNAFREGSKSIYETARANGWLDEVCSHMRLVGNKYKRCVYEIRRWDTFEIYIGLTYDFENRNHRRPHLKTLRENGEYIQLTDYIDADQACELEKFLIEEAHKSKNWTCLNISKGGQLSVCNGFYKND